MKKLFALLSFSPLAAFAAVPTGVTDAITTAGTDAGVIAAAVLVVIVGLVGFSLMRKQAH